jgi:RHS repeat-associated protein
MGILKRKLTSQMIVTILIVCILQFTTYDLVLALTNDGYLGLMPTDFGQVNAAGEGGALGNTFNANMFYPRIDFVIPGRGLPIEIAMFYNSRDRSVETPYGYGWNFSYNIRYSIQPNWDIEILWGDGRTDLFNEAGGKYYAPPGVNMTLVEYQTDKYLLTTKHGIKYYFNSPIRKAVTKIEDPNGNALTFSYTGDNLTTITDASGRSISLSYTGGKLTTITDPNTTPTRTLTYSYDANGNQVGFTDTLGNTTTYGYNSEHLLTSITDPKGGTTTITYMTPVGSPDVRRIEKISTPLSERQYDYDTAARKTTVTDILATTTQTTTYTYDSFGRVTEIKDAQGNSRTFTWDVFDNLISVTDENLNTTTLTYDSKGNVLSRTDALGNITSFTYDPTFNKLTSITDANGNTTTFSYDAKGNLTSIIDALGNSTTFSYDAYGQPTSITDARGNTTSFSYNSYGYLTQVTDPLANDTTLVYDNVGNLTSVTDPNGNTSTLEYDLANQLKKITDPLSNETTLSYDANGNITSITDANGNTTSYTYDQINRLTKVTNALSNETNYAYDEVGNLTSITDAKGNTTTYIHDSLNRLVSETDALGNTTSYVYDNVGNLISRTDANGNITNYTYDAVDRLTAMDYPGTNDTSISYDAVGNVTSIGNADANLTYTYDPLNRLTSETETNMGKSISYTYDEVSNRITMTDQDGGLTTYTYDELNRLISLTNPNSQTTTYTYDPGSRLTQKTLANGTKTLYSYDAANRLLSLVNKRSNDTTISAFSYTYDSVGNRLTMTEDGVGTTSYVYDSLYQLTNVTNPDLTTIDYTYDAVGNRTQKVDSSGTINYTYDAANRLTTADTVSYTYDNNGNLITKTEGTDVTSYTYDYEDRLIGVTLPSGDTNAFAYYPDGRRLSRIDVSGVLTKYVYDGPNAIMETDSGGSTVARYTAAGIDDWISMDRGGSSYFYHYDGLGSVRSLTDGLEVEVATYAYGSFGEITSQTGSVVNPYKYTGREHDEEVDLYFYRARHYDQSVGRFIGTDPLRGLLWDPQTQNPYSYVANNPVNSIDSFGLEAAPGDIAPGMRENFDSRLLGHHRAKEAVAARRFNIEHYGGTRGTGRHLSKEEYDIIVEQELEAEKARSLLDPNAGYRPLRPSDKFFVFSLVLGGGALFWPPLGIPALESTIFSWALSKQEMLKLKEEKEIQQKEIQRLKKEIRDREEEKPAGDNDGGHGGEDPPPKPDESKIKTTEPVGGYSTVSGHTGAVDGGSTVVITNINTGTRQTVTSNPDGSFPSTEIPANYGDALRINQIDPKDNASPATAVQVPQRGAPPIPTGCNTTWLIFTAISLMLAGRYLILQRRRRFA